MSPAHRRTYPPRRTVFWCLNFRFPESLQPVDSKRINRKSCVRTPLTDWRKTCSLYLTTESGILTIVYVINLLQYMDYWIQLIISMLQFISNMPQLMWSWSRPMSDKVCSDMGIFNGSFVDHSWICLLDRASGYVDKSFQKDSAHNRLSSKAIQIVLQWSLAATTVRTCFLQLLCYCASSPVRGLRPVTGLRRALFFLMSVFTGNFWRNLPYFLSVRSYPKYTSYVCFNARDCVYKLQVSAPVI